MSDTATRFVSEPEAVGLLSEYGIPYPEHGVARSAQEAMQVAERLGFPVVLKVVSPDVVHKSEAGGVVIGLENAAEVGATYGRIVTQVQAAVSKAHIEGMLVCRQAPEGFELIVGALEDAAFGPTVMFGLGGIFAEAMNDVSFRIAPLERKDAEEMMEEIRGYPMLTGARGQAAYDTNAVANLLLSVSRMIIDHPEIKELDLNPVRVYREGLLVLDTRVLARAEG